MADGRWRDLGLEIWLVAKTKYIYFKTEGLIWVYTGGGKIKRIDAVKRGRYSLSQGRETIIFWHKVWQK
jgi:hypothetical protein